MNLSTTKLIRRSLICAAALAGLVLMFSNAPLSAQTNTTTGTTTTGTTTTSTTTNEPSTTAPTNTRQPTVITNQFNAASGGSISARSPGKMVEQGLAEATGQLTIPGDATDEPPSFLKQTFDQIAQNMLTFFSDILTGINSFITGLSGTSGGSGGTSTTTFVVPPNAATTWSDTSQTIP